MKDYFTGFFILLENQIRQGDVIEIADESRYDQYDVFIEKPAPLVPRRLRFTVPERMDVHGAVRLALDETGPGGLVCRSGEGRAEGI